MTRAFLVRVAPVRVQVDSVEPEQGEQLAVMPKLVLG
jgi:hypothetical protein